MKRLLGLTVLGLGLLAPTAVTLSAQGEHHDQMARHEWKDSENETWHRYLKEKRAKDHEWDHASKREQANYWKWRDKHPDQH
jgi:hypothetical protein